MLTLDVLKILDYYKELEFNFLLKPSNFCTNRSFGDFELVYEYYKLNIQYENLKSYTENMNLIKSFYIEFKKQDNYIGTIHVEERLSNFDKKYALAQALVYFFLKENHSDELKILNGNDSFYKGYFVNPLLVFNKHETLFNKLEYIIAALTNMIVVPYEVIIEYDKKVQTYLQETYYEKVIDDFNDFSENIIEQLCKKYDLSKNIFYTAKFIYSSLSNFGLYFNIDYVKE